MVDSIMVVKPVVEEKDEPLIQNINKSTQKDSKSTGNQNLSYFWSNLDSSIKQINNKDPRIDINLSDKGKKI